MRIGIDVREACRKKRTGKGQWTYHWTGALLDAGCAVTLLSDELLPDDWRTAAAREPDRIRVPHVAGKGARWHWSAAAHVLRDDTMDVYVSPTSFIVPALIGARKPVIPVVHDLIAFHGGPHDQKAVLIERLTLGRAVRGASMVCTVSDTTKRDLLERYRALPPERVLPVYAASTVSCEGPRANSDPVILSIGTLCPRKNQERLIQAFASLPPSVRGDAKLVLIGGRGWRDSAIVRLAHETPGVEWQGYVDADRCRRELCRARVFAFLSLYEGFGLPVLDAFACGVPVLTSDCGSLREVAGDAALTVDPLSTHSIAHGLKRLLADASLRAMLAERGRERMQHYSWERSAGMFLDALPRILTKSGSSRNVGSC